VKTEPASFDLGQKNLPALRQALLKFTRGLVSKDFVVLRRWGRETQNYGFIN